MTEVRKIDEEIQDLRAEVSNLMFWLENFKEKLRETEAFSRAKWAEKKGGLWTLR